MKFQQTITFETNDEQLSAAVFTFEAPTWQDAAYKGNAIKAQVDRIGIPCKSIITYAPQDKPKPLGQLMDEDAERASLNAENGGKSHLSDEGGHR